MMNEKIVVIGAGAIGKCIAFLLKHTGNYQVTLLDKCQKTLDNIPMDIEKIRIDLSEEAQLIQILQDKHSVISACPFYLNVQIAQTASKTNTHYFDLTEDTKTTQAIEEIAKTSEISLMPQCGLAPGFIGISAFHLTKDFDTLQEVKLKVGALPMYPNNQLKYNLTWNLEGLINEYCNPCDVIVNGTNEQVKPLENYEVFHLEGVAYESFNTSGGLGYLHKELAGKVKNLSYQTIRYTGHCKLIKFLLNDLKLKEDRGNLKEIFLKSIPTTQQDVVIVVASVIGKKDGVLQEKSYVNKIYPRKIGGTLFTAIQISTASAVCTVVDLQREKKIPSKGFVTQEAINFEDFMNNRFGQVYQQ